MATLQANIVDGDDLQPEPVMANFNEIFTNINENNLAAAASLPSAKLDLSSIAKNISFASGYGVKLNTAFDAALSAEQADLSSGLTVWNTIGLNSAIFDLCRHLIRKIFTMRYFKKNIKWYRQCQNTP